MKKSWSEPYKISSFLVNLRGRAGLYAILNLIQDAGWMHAFALRIQLQENQTWVFTRQKLAMLEWPKLNETVTIRTWVRPPASGPFLYRDYEISLNDHKIGQCTSTFAVMNTESRKLVEVDFSRYSAIWNEENNLSYLPEKIGFDESAVQLAQFQVRNSDLDMNNHVNNTKYAQWILDALPLEILRGGVDLYEYQVNFLAETKSGDVVHLQKSEKEISEGDFTLVQFQGVRISDHKPVFTAQMKTKPSSP